MAANYNFICLECGWLGRMAQPRCRTIVDKGVILPVSTQAAASPAYEIAAAPTQVQTVLAGGDTGLFVSHDSGARWERVGTDGALPTIWSLCHRSG